MLENDVRELTQENFRLKYNSVLLLDADKFNPDPEWIVSADDYSVLWVNSAYVKRHLKPLGFTAIDLIGTDGSHIFGKENAKMFHKNNELVKMLNKPMVFKELSETLKYPIAKGGMIYAIKGTERLDYD